MSTPQKKKKSIPKPTHFGKNLKFLRRLNRLSQQELAKNLGINRNNIASYEAGSAEPCAKVCLQICDYFQKTPCQVLDSSMVDMAIENSQVLVPEIKQVQQEQFDETLAQIIFQTNEMTKMYEGYTSLIEMKNINQDDPISSQLYSSFSDLLDILRSLIKLNWDFMNTVMPGELPEHDIPDE